MVFPGCLGVLTLFTAASVSALSGPCVQIDPQTVSTQKSSWTALGGYTFGNGNRARDYIAILDPETGTLTLENGTGSRNCICVQLKSAIGLIVRIRALLNSLLH
jgi:hypothetical protein